MIIRVPIEVTQTGDGIKVAVAGLQEVEKTAKRAKESALSLKSAFSGFASGLGVGVGIASFEKLGTAIKSSIEWFAKAAQEQADFAEQIGKSSKLTGLSADTLQNYSKVAREMKVSNEAITASVSKVGIALANGNPAFERLGLSISDLKRMAPDQAFGAVAGALAEMSSAGERNAVAMALMGKGYRELMPALKALAESQGTFVNLSDDQLATLDSLDAALDKNETAWSELKAQMVEVGLAALGVDKGLQQAAEGSRAAAKAVKEHRLEVIALLSQLPMIGQFVRDTRGFFGLGGLLGVAVGGVGASPKAPGYGIPPSLVIPQGPTPAELEGERQDAERRKVADAELTKRKKELAEALAKYKSSLWDAVGLQNAMNTLNLDLNNRASGAGPLIGRGDMNALNAALGPGAEMSPAVIQGAVAGLDRVYEREKKITDQAVRWQGALQGVALLAGAIGGRMGDAINVVGNIGQSFKGFSTMSGTGKFNTIASGAGQIGGLIGGKAGGALSGAAGGAMMGAAIGSVFPVIGTAIGAVVGGLVGGIAGWISGGKKAKEQMKEMKEQFIEGAGGMSALTVRAQAAGVSLDKLFAAKDAKALEAAMAEVQKTIDAFEGKMNGLKDARAAAESLMDRVAKGGFSEKFGEAVQVMVQKVQDALLKSGLGYMASGPLRQSEAFMGAQGAASDVAQLIAGMRAGGAIDAGLLGAAGASAEELRAQAVSAAEAAGLAPAEATKAGFGAIAPLLREQLNAALASGQDLDENTKKLIEEAKANGISIVADPLVESVAVQRDMLKELKDMNGSGGGRPDAAFASGTIGLRHVRRDMLARIHAGEGLMVIPADEMARTSFGSFSRGTDGEDPRERYPRGGGGGGAAGSGDGAGEPGTAPTATAGAVQAAILEFRRRPAPVTQVFQPTFKLDPLQTKESREELARALTDQFLRDLRNNPTVQYAVQRAAKTR